MVAVAFATKWSISLTDTDVGANSLQASCWSFSFSLMVLIGPLIVREFRSFVLQVSNDC